MQIIIKTDMQKLVSPQLSLKGSIINLETLKADHLPGLQIASKPKEIWTHYAIDASQSETFHRAFEQASVSMEAGYEHCFVIVDRADQRVIGSTRFMNIEPTHRKLEIGWTWLHPDYWGTAVNFECKLLLLTHCFEQLNIARVQIKTDELNTRSRRAIEKLGATYEGILRNDMVRQDGSHRNSAYYSIIIQEWPAIKELLVQNLSSF